MQTANSKLLDEIGELLALHYADWQVQDHQGPEVAFGRYLRSVRQVQTLTIAEVAAKANVAESELLAYEHGLIPKRWIKERSLTALAKTLDEAIETFLLLLEADIINEAAPKPSAKRRGKRDQRFFSGSEEADYPDADNTSGAVAACDRKGVLWNSRVMPDRIECTKPLSTMTAGVTQKPSLRQVLGDPRWQVKIYRVWTPVVTLLLFFCLQVQALRPNWVWQPDYYPSFSAAAKLAQADSNSSHRSPILADKTSQNATPQEKTVAKLPEAIFVELGGSSVGPAQPASVHAARRFIQPNTGLALGEDLSSIQVSEGENWEILPLTLPIEDLPLPVVHMIGAGEVLACISNQYYKTELLYPLLCLYNFGNLQCPGSLQPGDRVEIPVFEDFQLEDPPINQALTQLPNTLIEDFKAVSREALYVNQTVRLRGVDYFCHANDYQNFGKPLVLAGKIKDPSQRIPGWSSTKG